MDAVCMNCRAPETGGLAVSRPLMEAVGVWNVDRRAAQRRRRRGHADGGMGSWAVALVQRPNERIQRRMSPRTGILWSWRLNAEVRAN